VTPAGSGRASAWCWLLVQVRDCLRLAWVSEEDPGKGLQYIYLSEPDYQRLAKSVRADLLVLPCGERRWVVSDIIGQEDGLGVENLSGSAAIGTLFCRLVYAAAHSTHRCFFTAHVIQRMA